MFVSCDRGFRYDEVALRTKCFGVIDKVMDYCLATTFCFMVVSGVSTVYNTVFRTEFLLWY